MRILIADDSERVRKSLVRLLSNLKGLEIVGEAANAAEAVAKTKALHPDVLILDMKMPGGSGLEVLATIRKQKHQPTVVMLTNYATEQFRTESLKAGADFFFDKSTEFEKVYEVVESSLKT